MGVVDYISSRILAKVSCSLALPTPDDHFELSMITLLLQTSIIVKNKNIILYFYIYVFLIVHQDTAVVYNSMPKNTWLSQNVLQYSGIC